MHNNKTDITDRDIDTYFQTPYNEHFKEVPNHLDHKILDDLDTIMEKSAPKGITLFFTQKKYLIPAAAIILILTGIITYFYRYPSTDIRQADISYIAHSRGTVQIQNANNETLSTATIYEHNIIETGDDGGCTVRLPDDSTITLFNNTQLHFNEVSHDKKDNRSISLLLEKGIVHCKINPLKSGSTLSIETKSLIATVIGTEFIIDASSGQNEAIVTVYNGAVHVAAKNTTAGSLSLSSNTIAVYKSEKITASSLSAPKNTTLKNTYEHLLRTMNEPVIPKDQTGDTSHHEDLNKIQIQKKDTNHSPRIKPIAIPVKSTKIFALSPYPDNTNEKPRIIDIRTHKTTLIATGESYILCLGPDNRVIWRQSYGQKENIFFMSPPVIHNNMIYISTINKKLLILRAADGKEIDRISMPGNNTFGYAMGIKDDTLYLPYADGLYTFDTKTNQVSNEPYIPFNSPSTPLITQTAIVLLSYIENKAAIYRNNRLLKSFSLNKRSYTAPVQSANAFYITDTSGVLYEVSKSGRIKKTVTLPYPALSAPVAVNNELYAVLGDGFLYKITAGQPVKLLSIDENGAIKDYLYKTLKVYGSYLAIGNNRGEILFYNPITRGAAQVITTGTAKITTPVITANDVYYVGNTIGEIFLLE